MTMTKGYNPDSERKYTAPEAPRIIEPEPMIPKWLKKPILYSMVLGFLLNVGGFSLASICRSVEMSKSEIEERIDKSHSDGDGLGKLIIDNLSKPGRKLAYSIFGDGEQEK